jgi:hypothetical protein
MENGTVGQDLVGRLMADMDPELLDFVRQTLDSFLKWDLIRLFYDNPHIVDTAERIAWYTGREAEAIGAELAELATRGVLVRSQLKDPLGDLTMYSLSDDARVRDLIGRFVEASDGRRFRAQVVYHVIQRMRQEVPLSA